MMKKNKLMELLLMNLAQLKESRSSTAKYKALYLHLIKNLKPPLATILQKVLSQMTPLIKSPPI